MEMLPVLDPGELPARIRPHSMGQGVHQKQEDRHCSSYVNHSKPMGLATPLSPAHTWMPTQRLTVSNSLVPLEPSTLVAPTKAHCIQQFDTPTEASAHLDTHLEAHCIQWPPLKL